MRGLTLFRTSNYVQSSRYNRHTNFNGVFNQSLKFNKNKFIRKSSSSVRVDSNKESEVPNVKINYTSTFELWMKKKLISPEIFIKYIDAQQYKQENQRNNNNQNEKDNEKNNEKDRNMLFVGLGSLLTSLALAVANAYLNVIQKDRDILLNQATEAIIKSNHDLIDVLFERTLCEPRSLLELTVNKNLIAVEIRELEALNKKILLNLVKVESIYNQINYNIKNNNYVRYILKNLDFQISVLRLCCNISQATLAFRKRDSNAHSLILTALRDYENFILKESPEEEQMAFAIEVPIKKTYLIDSELNFALNRVISNTYNINGILYDLKRELESALCCYRNANKLYNNNPAILNNMGMACAKYWRELIKKNTPGEREKATQLYKEALDCQQRAYRCKPNNENDFFILHGLGLLLCQTDDEDNNILALNYFNDAIRLKPNFIPSLIHRAILLKKMGKFESAIEDLTKIINIHDVLIETYYCRATVFYQLRKYQEALEDLNKSSIHRKQFPTSPPGYSDEEYQLLYDNIQKELNNSRFKWLCSFFLSSFKEDSNHSNSNNKRFQR